MEIIKSFNTSKKFICKQFLFFLFFFAGIAVKKVFGITFPFICGRLEHFGYDRSENRSIFFKAVRIYNGKAFKMCIQNRIGYAGITTFIPEIYFHLFLIFFRPSFFFLIFFRPSFFIYYHIVKCVCHGKHGRRFSLTSVGTECNNIIMILKILMISSVAFIVIIFFQHKI